MTLNLTDEDMKTQAYLDVSPQGAIFTLYINRERRLILGVNPDGSSVMTLLDKGEKGRVGIGVANNGGASLGVNDKDGIPAVAMNVEPDGSSNLAFYDRKGKVIWSAP